MRCCLTAIDKPSQPQGKMCQRNTPLYLTNLSGVQSCGQDKAVNLLCHRFSTAGGANCTRCGFFMR